MKFGAHLFVGLAVLAVVGLGIYELIEHRPAFSQFAGSTAEVTDQGATIRRYDVGPVAAFIIGLLVGGVCLTLIVLAAIP
ncbi:MAG TPA: hypothetical protein VMB05_18400 [Solirubrobacteraceae bacterium]|nr:hypothetical protein [Solirubrobacteraceae bacterium]